MKDLYTQVAGLKADEVAAYKREYAAALEREAAEAAEKADESEVDEHGD
jgi:hypothetical protein